MPEIVAIPAFKDNYIWLLHCNGLATVIDPGDAQPVEQFLRKLDLQLHSILVTHHHDDHIGGIKALQNRWQPDIYAPIYQDYAFSHLAVQDGDCIQLPHLQQVFNVMHVPGHTLDHVAYYGANRLFCGDTLFSAGCGRLFEGTPQQMLHSLRHFKALPPETEVYCTHEYTEHNLKFAHMLEPTNAEITQRQKTVRQLRSHGKPSLPSSIAIEKTINPFLRCDDPTFRQNLGFAAWDELAVFTHLRQRRNNF